MDRSEALELVKSRVKNANLVKHMLAAEAIMRALAPRFGGDPHGWGLAGLLHDLDYDETYDKPEIHGLETAKELERRGVEPEIIHAVLAHAGKAPLERAMDKAIYATDPLTGFLVACALMTPNKKLAQVDVPFVLRRFKEKAFARGANREQMRSCEGLGLTLEEFIEIGLEAMGEIAEELGL